MGDTDALVKDANEVKNALSSIDWSFYSGSTGYANSGVRPFNVRRHHWYPATFVPEIPFALIEVLSSTGARVYDPFSGIGTTYFQALLLNRVPLGTEICRVSVDYTRNLLTLFDPDYEINRVRRQIHSTIEGFSAATDYTNKVPDSILMDKLEPWFHPEVFNELSFLFFEEDRSEEPHQKAAMRIVISSILMKLCAQNRGWGCVADNMLPTKDQIEESRTDGIRVFTDRLNQLLDDTQSHLKDKDGYYQKLYNKVAREPTIYHSDVRLCTSIPSNSVDLVITSPPYPEMTDYVSSQRLPYYWHGYNVGLQGEESDMNREIGARRKRGRKSSHSDYLQEMKETNERIIERVKTGGYLAYLLPILDDDKDERKNIVEDVLIDVEAHGEIHKVDDYNRVIHPTQRAHNIKWTSLDEEKISLFQKV